MTNKKRLRCTDCRKAFASLKALNVHITKTGHEDRKKVQASELIDIALSKSQSKKSKRHFVVSYLKS
jgi:hypothetical protein